MAFLSITLAIGVGFQNCSGYAAVNNPLYDNASTTTCIGLACGMDTSLLKLQIANDSAVSVQKVATMPADCTGNDSRCIDIGGYCDDGGFPTNQIWATISGGTVNVPEYFTGATCVDGRFSAQIVLPNGYDYDNVHALYITIYGFNASSVNRFTNETSGNQRLVNIVSYTSP